MQILGKDYTLVTLDLETYYGTGCSLSLQKLNTYSYLAHEDFEIHGVGVKVDDGATQWIEPGYIEDWLTDIWETSDKPIALLCQNTYFDGFILHHFYDLHPDLYLDTMGMSRGMFPGQPASLKELAKRLWPNDLSMRKGEELVNFRNVTTDKLYDNPAMLRSMIDYCIQDVELTYAAFHRMVPHYPDDELRLIHLTLQMTCEPVLQVDVPRVKAAREQWIKEREATIAEAGVAESTLSSNPKFEQLLRKNGVEIKLKQDPKTEEWKPALGKADLGFQQMWADNPNLDAIFRGRVAAKSVGQISRAARFVETAEICGGWMPCPLIYYSAHCVPGDTEVLTEDGWQRIDEWDGGIIAQVREDQSITFDEATRFVGPEVDEWVVSDARYMPCAFTLGHTVPYLQHGSFRWSTLPAGDAPQRSSLYVPIGGNLESEGTITAPQMRVLVMVQADGSYCTDSAQGRQMAIFVKKPRKIERARQLLNAAGVPFRESSFPSHPGYVRFTVAARDYPEWLTPERKVFGAWLLDSTSEAREAFVQEISRWDGGYNGDVQRTYTSSIRENVDWAVTLCHLAGHSASICVNPANNRGGHDRKDNYVVNIRRRAYAQIKRKQWRTENTRRRTYCTETKTGFWLARANGRIFVTGNTGRYGGGEKLNLQNLNRGSELRRSLIAPAGQLVYVADSSNIEARMLAWMSGQPDLLDVFRAGGDVYSHFASKLYGFEVNKHDHPHERFVGKVCIAEGSQVLTDKGLVAIEKVTTRHKVWDGVEWVQHDGLIYQGFKEVITYGGVTATPDHEVYTEGSPDPIQLGVAASRMDRLLQAGSGGQAIRVGDSYLPAHRQRGGLPKAFRPLHRLWHGEADQYGQPAVGQDQWVPKLLPAAIDFILRTREAIRCLGVAMQFANESGLRTLRGTRDTLQLYLSGRVHPVCGGGVAAPGLQGGGDRPHQQRRALRAWQPAACIPLGAEPQQGAYPAHNVAGETNPTSGVPVALRLYPDVPVHEAGPDRRADHQTGLAVGAGEAQRLEGTPRKAHVYDIANAGPRRRFTVDGVLVANCVLGLGYGMGWRKFQEQMAAGMLGGDPVLLTDQEAQSIVNLYRTSNYMITEFWSQAQAAIVDMYLGNERDWGPLKIAKNMLVMPNGMALKYPGLRPMDEHGNDFEYWNGKFWTKIYGGKITENIIQALSRIVLFDQMLDVNELLEAHDGRVALNVHDEIIGVGPQWDAEKVHTADPAIKGDKDVWKNAEPVKDLFGTIIDLMSTAKGWYSDLPLEAEGGFDFSYSK